MENFQEKVKELENVKLDLELMMYLQKTPLGISMIKHPLVFDIFYTDIGFINDRLNKMLEYKKKALNKAIKEKDYSNYVFLHERPYRVFAFEEICDNMDDKSYWEILGDIWVDSENIWQNKKNWKRFLSSKRKNKEYFMNDEERKEFKKLPDELIIFRGYVKNKNKTGYSFTIDEEQAFWFSNRFGKDGDVLSLKVKKSDVFAFINRRGENEIVYLNDPKNF